MKISYFQKVDYGQIIQVTTEAVKIEFITSQKVMVYEEKSAYVVLTKDIISIEQ